MLHSQIAYQTGQLDKITALGSNRSLTFTSYYTFSNDISNWTTFVKEVFGFNACFTKWQNDFLVKQVTA